MLAHALSHKCHKKAATMDDLIYIDLALDLGLLHMLRLMLREEASICPTQANRNCPATCDVIVQTHFS